MTMADYDTPTPAQAVAVVDAVADHTMLAVMHERQVQMDKKADIILAQTLKTNGRVNDLEAWRDKVKGAYLAASIFGPLITGLIVGAALKYSH